jgi:hypothetical protein
LLVGERIKLVGELLDLIERVKHLIAARTLPEPKTGYRSAPNLLMFRHLLAYLTGQSFFQAKLTLKLGQPRFKSESSAQQRAVFLCAPASQ